jgi:hypothetical protein
MGMILVLRILTEKECLHAFERTTRTSVMNNDNTRASYKEGRFRIGIHIQEGLHRVVTILKTMRQELHQDRLLVLVQALQTKLHIEEVVLALQNRPSIALVLALLNRQSIIMIALNLVHLSRTSIAELVLLHARAHDHGLQYMSDTAEIDLDLDPLMLLHCSAIRIDRLLMEENDRLIVPALQTLRLRVLKDSQPPIPSLNPRLR